jgi:circadian clock protein KaiC
VADCVVLLDHRVTDQISTRRFRVVKYRGSFHGTNEYPFLIGERGISVLPVTSMGLNHKASTERLSTGILRLDVMLDGKGLFRGSSVLVSGTAGSGKSTLAANFAAAAARRGERALYIAFEESPSQIMRNMRSVGISLEPFVKNGLLQFHATRPTYHGLEMHLVAIHEQVERFKPRVVVLDPVTNLTAVGSDVEVKSMLTRLIDFLKTRNITALFTSLTSGGSHLDQSEVGVSSLMDTWILVRNLENGGERNRALHVLKSRGTAHSNQVREFRITNRGIDLIDVYIGNGEVLVGSARVAQEKREQADELARRQQALRRKRDFARKRAAMAAQIAALEASLQDEEEEMKVAAAVENQRLAAVELDRKKMSALRKADSKYEG